MYQFNSDLILMLVISILYTGDFIGQKTVYADQNTKFVNHEN